MYKYQIYGTVSSIVYSNKNDVAVNCNNRIVNCLNPYIILKEYYIAICSIFY